MASRDPEKYREAPNGNGNGNYSNFAPPPGRGYYIETSRRQWTSWLVPMIVVANIGVFIISMVVNNCPKNNFDSNRCLARFLGRLSFQPFHENPLLGPSTETLVKMGALQLDKLVHEHQGWRLITCIWLHGGLIHIFVNMTSLVLMGIRLEQQFGFVRVGILYLISGVGGSVLSSLFLQRTISVGASGALFGILGAMLSELLTNWTIYENKGGVLFNLLIVIVINVAIGILPLVDNFAHIGGLVSGFLLGFVLLMQPKFGWIGRNQLPEHARVKTKYLSYQLILFFIALLALIAGFLVALVMLFHFQGRNGTEHCNWCKYLRCIQISKWQCDN